MSDIEPLVLDENRYFDPEPSVRKTARELYEDVKELPIVSPHGHVDPAVFVENKPFSDPAEVLVVPDHYVFRMLYSQGVDLDALGIPKHDGTRAETDGRKIWRLFAEHFHLFAGTPTGAWLNHELYELFGVREKLNAESAARIYDRIQEKLDSPEYLPRALYERFNIEVLTTTDGAADTLANHEKIRDDSWAGRIIPCFRPDSVIDIASKGWKKSIRALEKASGVEITSYRRFISAIQEQRKRFKSMGAVSTDQGVMVPFAHGMNNSEAEGIFLRALKGKDTTRDAALFTAHMLMEMARMSAQDGLVMQIHPGSFRNHNRLVFEKYGPDVGCDIPITTEYTRSLRELLEKYGNSTRFKLILFTLDESSYSRELAPLAGHYPALKLGPAWWFLDSIEGMTRYREMVTETAGIYNTVGFNDDTRAFPSIPARHDMSRRVDSNYLAGLVARHIIDMSDARRMSRALAYDLVKESYNLG